MKILILEESVIVSSRILDITKEIDGTYSYLFSGKPSEIGDYIRQTRPDIIILDLGFYQYRGTKLLKFIKNVLPESTVIILSDLPFFEYRLQCIDMGADYFLDKSFEIDRLSDIIMMEKYQYRSPASSSSRFFYNSTGAAADR